MNNHFELMFNAEQKAVDAKLMHKNLGLNTSNWSKWSKLNIENNEYFKENESWQGFVLSTSGNETKNYWISLEMAKHLCMTSKGKAAHEVREYFLECERKLIAAPTNELSLEEMTLKVITGQQERIKELENRNKEVTDTLLVFQKDGSPLCVRDFVKYVYTEKQLEIKEKDVWKLIDSKYIYWKYVDGHKKRMPKANYQKYFAMPSEKYNGKIRRNLKLSRKGVIYFANILVKQAKENETLVI